MSATAPAFEPFVGQQTILLTTYRRDRTPINIALDGEGAFVRLWDTAWKAKRIRNNPEVEIAPSTVRGKPTGPAVHARARILDGEESEYAGKAIARKHPVVHGLFVSLVHRLRKNKTIHIELTPVGTASRPLLGSRPAIRSLRARVLSWGSGP